MAFQLTDNFIQDLRSALSAKDEVLMRSLMADLHPADAAELLAEFEVEEAMRLVLVVHRSFHFITITYKRERT